VGATATAAIIDAARIKYETGEIKTKPQPRKSSAKKKDQGY
jgi:hypothetical protein